LDLSSIKLDDLYAGLKGIVQPPLQQPVDVEEEPIVLVAVKELCYWAAKAFGWTFKGEVPQEIKQAVVIIAPHTSLLDLPLSMAAYRYFKNIKGNYLAKKELFQGPFKFIYEKTGGIPVDRSKSNDLVEQVTQLFEDRETFFLALAPEGTRSFTKKWKSGFYRMAVGADVPIILAYLDFGKKEAGIGDIIYPSGNYEADAKKIEAFYKKVTPFWPKKFNWKVV
jgi:1-acyl-sn-glycerol-3-phosphate acyltransferase